MIHISPAPALIRFNVEASATQLPPPLSPLGEYWAFPYPVVTNMSYTDDSSTDISYTDMDTKRKIQCLSQNSDGRHPSPVGYINKLQYAFLNSKGSSPDSSTPPRPKRRKRTIGAIFVSHSIYIYVGLFVGPHLRRLQMDSVHSLRSLPSQLHFRRR